MGIKTFQAYRDPKRVPLVNKITKQLTGAIIDAWGGWEWTTNDGRAYRTDAEGRGLWRWMHRANEWRQIAGTNQFSLPRDEKSARRAVETWMKRTCAEVD